MPADPVGELLELPKEYGTPEVPLAWDDVVARLAGAIHYGWRPCDPMGDRLRPERVLSWGRFPRDATRFVFGPAG